MNHIKTPHLLDRDAFGNGVLIRKLSNLVAGLVKGAQPTGPGVDDEKCRECGKDIPENRLNALYCSDSCEDSRFNRMSEKQASPEVLHRVVWFLHPGEVKPISEITAELAVSPKKRAQGLQGRENLHPATGMLFLTPKK